MKKNHVRKYMRQGERRRVCDENGDTKTYSDVSLLDNNTTIEVKNNIGASLPSTGGPGTGLFTVTGLILIAGAGLLLRKRRKTIFS